MIEVSLSFLNKLTNAAVSKVLEKVIKNKTGLDAQIDISKFELSNNTEESKVTVHIDTVVSVDQQELLDLIFKKGQ